MIFGYYDDEKLSKQISISLFRSGDPLKMAQVKGTYYFRRHFEEKSNQKCLYNHQNCLVGLYVLKWMKRRRYQDPCI